MKKIFYLFSWRSLAFPSIGRNEHKMTIRARRALSSGDEPRATARFHRLHLQWEWYWAKGCQNWRQIASAYENIKTLKWRRTLRKHCAWKAPLWGTLNSFFFFVFYYRQDKMYIVSLVVVNYRYIKSLLLIHFTELWLCLRQKIFTQKLLKIKRFSSTK